MADHWRGIIRSIEPHPRHKSIIRLNVRRKADSATILQCPGALDKIQAYPNEILFVTSIMLVGYGPILWMIVFAALLFSDREGPPEDPAPLRAW